MLLDYLPFFISELNDFKLISNIFCQDIEKLTTSCEQLLKDFFILDTGEVSLNHYEKMLDITPRLTDSIEKRKRDILAIYQVQLPYTTHHLKQMLNGVVGFGHYKLVVDTREYLIQVKLNLSKKYLMESVINLLERIVPVNIILKLDLDYNTWEDVKRFNWGYIKNVDWIGLKESEDIKNG